MLLSVTKAISTLLTIPKLVFKSDSADYYAYLGDDVIEGEHENYRDPNKPLWLNLGYWKTARRYPDAARALATVLGDAAKLGPGLDLLDVGFGFAEQDFFWLEHYGLRHITGLNITPIHVERANQRVRERNLQDRMDLRLGSATEIPFPEASFDRVTALECAHHFAPRTKFFEEAFRVLRPGGRLATADGIRYPGSKPLTFVNRLVLKRWSVPLENMYDRDEYKRKLEEHGFVNVTYESIRQYVFPGVTKYQALRHAGRSLQDAVIDLSDEEIERCEGIERWEKLGTTDYVIFAADKPA